MKAWPRRLRSQIQEFGVIPADGEGVRVRKEILTVAGFLTGLVLIVVFGPIYLIYDEPAAALTYILFGSFVWINLFLFGFWHTHYRLTVLILAVTALPAHWLAALSLGGYSRSHGVILWGLFFPVLGSLIFLSARFAVLWFLVYAAGVAVMIHLEPWLRPANNIPPFVGRVLLSLGVITTSLFTLGIMMYFVAQLNRALA